MSQVIDQTSNQSNWFLQFQGKVEGPYNATKLEQTLHAIGDSQLDRIFIWRRGLTEWMRASKWNPNEEITNVSAASGSAPVYANDISEKTFAHTMTENAFYRVQLNFIDQPLMTRAELLALIGKQGDVATISIHDPKTKEWKEVYAFPDLVERLGLTRRSHQRVPILAQFAGSSNKNPKFDARIISISEGGVGFTDMHELQIADTIEGNITSPHFFQPISIKAEVIYSGQDGYVGLKFSHVTDEAKATIIEYIKKFGKSSHHP